MAGQCGFALFRQGEGGPEPFAGSPHREQRLFSVTIGRRACKEPVRRSVLNSGTESAVVAAKIIAGRDPNFGFNVSTAMYEGVVKAEGIESQH